jgi:branched-chain amino acid transport system substrate-binding protein
MKPAGFENSQGIITSSYLMDPTDPQWKDNAGMKEWVAFMDKWNPSGDKTDAGNIYAYNVARTLVLVLKQCGDDLTRANIMKQAASIKDFEPGTLLPGIKVNTSPTDFYPIEQEQLQRFKGETWELFGPTLSGEVAG